MRNVSTNKKTLSSKEFMRHCASTYLKLVDLWWPWKALYAPERVRHIVTDDHALIIYGVSRGSNLELLLTLTVPLLSY